jgi:hypothetical protein
VCSVCTASLVKLQYLDHFNGHGSRLTDCIRARMYHEYYSCGYIAGAYVVLRWDTFEVGSSTLLLLSTRCKSAVHMYTHVCLPSFTEHAQLQARSWARPRTPSKTNSASRMPAGISSIARFFLPRLPRSKGSHLCRRCEKICIHTFYCIGSVHVCTTNHIQTQYVYLSSQYTHMPS